MSDFCFGKGVGVGNFGFTVTQDANKHLILLAASWSAYDETRGTWLRHLEPMFEAYGDDHMRAEGIVHVVARADQNLSLLCIPEGHKFVFPRTVKGQIATKIFLGRQMATNSPKDENLARKPPRTANSQRNPI